MRRRVLAMLLLILLCIPMAAQAVSTRTIRVVPSITFNENTAICSVTVFADNSDDDISITVKLWQGNACLKTWSKTGSGYLYFSESKTVTEGKTYKMTADVSINGKRLSRVSDSGTCG